MKKLPFKKIVLNTTLIFLLGFIFLTVSKVQAQTILPLTVAPARQELLVDPGEQTAVVLKFLNQGETPVTGLLKVTDFIVEDKEGSPTFLEDQANLSPRFTAASWVQLPYEQIAIASKDKVVIQAKINVPQDAQAGGRYFAILFEPGGIPSQGLGAEKEAETPITIRLAGLVYLRVAGPIEENAYVTALTAPRFLEYGPVNVLTEISNQGNYHIRPKGTVSLISVFGKKVDEELLFEQNIFPENSRVLENKLGGRWLFGKYKIELQATYGETGKILTATVFTWIIPWKLISIILVGLVVLILLFSLFHHRLRRREKELEEKIEQLEEKLEEEQK